MFVLFAALIIDYDVHGKPETDYIAKMVYSSKDDCNNAARIKFKYKSGKFFCEELPPGATMSIPMAVGVDKK